jgi:hypothetical protein
MIHVLLWIAPARQNAIRRKQEEAKRAEQERIRREEERRTQIEEARAKRLRQDAAAHSGALKIRQYVEAVRENLERREMDGERREEVAAWLRWADACVEQIDPLADSQNLPRIGDAELSVAESEEGRRYSWQSPSWHPPRQPR